MKVIIKNARLAFPSLFTKDSKFEKYGAQLLIQPDSKSVDAVEKAIEEAAKQKWAAKAESNLKAIRAGNKICMYDGDVKADYAGFEGMTVVSATSNRRPTVVGRDKAPLTEEDGIVYAGCYVNAVVDVWAQDNEWGKRINATLVAVQFVKDGESFGGGAQFSDDDFDDLSEEDEEAASDLF